MPLILSGNVASALPTGYSIANSCRFNDGDSPVLEHTTVAGGDRKTITISVWVKRGVLGTTQVIMSDANNDNDRAELQFNSSDQLRFFNNDDSSTTMDLVTNRLFRDCSAWYHIVARLDTTQSTEADRVRIYVNGVQETSFATATYQSEDSNTSWNKGNEGTYNPTIGRGHTTDFFDGYIAEVIRVDGSSLAPTSFGEFDDDSPTIWKPIDPSGITFGNRGQWLDFADSADLGDDNSGNTLDFAETNIAAVDQCTDTPTNNFCTLNFVDSFYRATWGGYSEGNTVATTSSTGGDYAYATTTIGLTAGKWYWEQKIVQNSGNYDWVGVTGQIPINDTDYVGKPATGYGYLSDDNIYNNNSATDNWGDTFTDDDIMSVALDLDNLKVYFGKNGTWQNSGDPTTGATGTGAAYTLTAVASTPAGAYFPTCGDYSGHPGIYAMNFGNPSYANSSSAADANGYGAFEYAPPSGYLAICTKNLGSDGG